MKTNSNAMRRASYIVLTLTVVIAALIINKHGGLSHSSNQQTASVPPPVIATNGANIPVPPPPASILTSGGQTAVPIITQVTPVPRVLSPPTQTATRSSINPQPIVGSSSPVSTNASVPTQKAGWPRPLPAGADLSQMELVDILAQPVDVLNPAARAEQERQLKLVSQARRQAAIARAAQAGLPTKGATRGGGTYSIQYFAGDRPVYYSTHNANAAISTAANQVRGNSAFPGIDGSGITVGVWDGGLVRCDHLAFRLGATATSRIVPGDNAGHESHPTHVAGTIAGLAFTPGNNIAGDPNAILSANVAGMAPGAFIASYDFNDDIAEIASRAAATGELGGTFICVSNHSYGRSTGWLEAKVGNRWGWYWLGSGNGQSTSNVDRHFGNYEQHSAELDLVVQTRPFLLPIIAAGNDGSDNPEDGSQWVAAAAPTIQTTYSASLHARGDAVYKSGYDTLNAISVSKNTLVVGSLHDAVSGGVRNTAPDVARPSDFTSWGPADDGRIKPDIVANGDEVASADITSDSAASWKSGTSMAAPNVTGSAALLQQLYRTRFDGLAMRASLLKGLIIHTATDLDTPGPDYKTGWGLMNTRAAADLIELHAVGLGGGELFDDTVATSATKTFVRTWDGTQPLRVTLCWTDPNGAFNDNPTTDDRVPRLVNDLDLTITGPTGTVHLPYVMPYTGLWINSLLGAAATTGTNNVDNVEQVYVPAPVSGSYTIAVTPRGSLSGGSQTFSLIISGEVGEPSIAVEQPVGTPLTDGVSTVSFGTASTVERVVKTFRVRNPGGADLQLTSFTVNGANAGDFTIVQPESTLLKPYTSIEFGVIMAPSAAGARTAALHIGTGLPGALSSFDVGLTGTGTTAVTFTPTYDVLKSFDLDSPGNASGYSPRGGLVFDGATAYGNTYGGGTNLNGVAFTVNTAGSFSLLGSVYTASPPGAPVQPIGPFTSGGTLLGISLHGGSNSSGTLYSMSGGTATTFCSFPSSHSGGAYGSNVVSGPGGYYGTATFGGTGGFGTIFKVSTAGVYSVVVNFTGTGGASKGSQPCPQLVVGADGLIYGATRFGGTNDLGTVFRLNGSTLETLLEFGAVSGNTLGVNPTVAPIYGSDGALYGTAGTRVYRVSTTGGGTSLGTTSYGIATPLLEGPDGRLYGVSGTGPYVLRITLLPFGGPYTSMTSSQYLDFYASPPVFPPPQTPTPSPLALGPDGHLYGTTQTGGVNGDGTVYRVLTNFGAPPEIDVQQPVGTSLTAGQTFFAPVLFPNIAVGQSVTRNFVVENTSATGTLFLKRLVKGGTHASDFTLVAPTQTEVGPGRSTSFSVTFTPAATGVRQAYIEIHSNDTDESVFDIGLTNAIPEIVIEAPAGTSLVDGRGVIDFGNVYVGAGVPRTIAVKNTGTGELKITGASKTGSESASFSVGDPTTTIASGASATFSVAFSPTSAGFKAVDLHIDNNDGDEDPFDLTLAGTGVVPPAPQPEISVEQPAGSTLTSSLSVVDFGTSGVGVAVPRTFTIRNTSTSATLVIDNITIDGANASDFVAGAPGAAVVPPSGSTTLVVTFTRAVATGRSATLHVSSNACDDSPFDVQLAAPTLGAALPDITVMTAAGVGVVDGSATPLSFGTVNVGQSKILSLIIQNDGLIPLTLGKANIGGANAGDFSAAPTEITLLPPGVATTLRVTVRPAAGGTRNAAFHLYSTDPDESPFDINLTGIGVSGPEIAVEQPAGTNLIDGVANIGMGTLTVGASSATQTFTIRNVGSLSLTGIAVTKAATGNPADFVLNTTGMSTTLAASASTTFTVNFTPTTAGARTAALLIASNDTDENPFDIALNGTGTSPAAQITSPADGSTFTTAAVTFNWSAGTGVTSYALWIGSALGGYDVYAGNEGTALSRMVTLPTDGRTLYVTLHSLIGGAYQNNKYTYTAYRAPQPVKARLTSPTNGSALNTTALALNWDAGVGVTSYYLFVGTTVDGYNLYAGDQGTNLSRNVTVPATGGKVYVTLWSLIKGSYQGNTYVFTSQTPVKAALTSPTNGTTLGDGNLNLTWNAGIGVTNYAIWIGSYEGAYDLGSADAGTSLARAMTVPVDGSPVYVTLWSLINGGYQANNYWFTTALPGGSRPARLTSHANTSTLTTRDTTFTWDNGVNATLFYLMVGSTPNSYDIYGASEGMNTSRTVTLPADGRRIHVTLFTMISGVWQSNCYWFTDSISATPLYAVINTPATGATLTSATLPLGWTTGTNVNNYFLYLGSAPSGYDLYSGSQGINLSKTLTVPTDGRPVYATLFSLIKGAYQQSSTWFTTVNLSGTFNKARMISPANGSVLPGASTTFNWDPGLAASNYALWIGSTPGAYDLYAGAEGGNIARTVTLPTDSRKIHVTLHSLISGAYQSNSYFYTAASIAPVKAAITSPAPGSIFTSASQTFTWSASNAATAYAFWIGRKPGNYDIYAGAEGTNLSKTVNTLPTDGSPVYVTLYSLIKGAWQSNEYIYSSWLQP